MLVQQITIQASLGPSAAPAGVAAERAAAGPGGPAPEAEAGLVQGVGYLSQLARQLLDITYTRKGRWVGESLWAVGYQEAESEDL